MNRLLLTIADAAEQLSVSARTVRRMVDAKELPIIRVRGSVRIPAAALEQWSSLSVYDLSITLGILP